jgi:transcriptional regulator with XRE-family HTH domain
MSGSYSTMISMAKHEYPYLQTVLANNVRSARNQIGLSQQQLAEAAGISTNFIAQIEMGRKYPSPTVLERIAKCLGLRPYQLLYDEPNASMEAEQAQLIISNLQKSLIDQINTIAEKARIELGRYK